MRQPRVSIVILNWNGLEDAIKCLDSLRVIIYSNYEVIVVDNGSEGGEADILEKRYRGYIRLVRNKENLGFAGGNNVAIGEVIKEGKSDYILLLNNDTLVTERFLEELVKVAETNERIGICGVKLLRMDNHKIIDSTGHVFWRPGIIIERGQGELDRGQYDEKTDVIGAVAAAALYRKKLFEDIGLFKEEFTGYDDAEFSWRAWKNKWESKFVPSAIVYHRRNAYTFKYKNKNLQAVIRTINCHADWTIKLRLALPVLIEICINLVKILANVKDKKERKKIVLLRIQFLQNIWRKS